MASEALSQRGQFIEVSWGFQGLLICSMVFLVLRWAMLEKVLGDVASRCWPCLVAKFSHVEVHGDRLACLLHRPTTCNHETRG
jgi:hypothetical protein